MEEFSNKHEYYLLCNTKGFYSVVKSTALIFVCFVSTVSENKFSSQLIQNKHRLFVLLKICTNTNHYDKLSVRDSQELFSAKAIDKNKSEYSDLLLHSFKF